MSAITSVLRNHETAAVQLQRGREKLEALSDLVGLRYPSLAHLKIVGFVDGCKVAIKKPNDIAILPPGNTNFFII